MRSFIIALLAATTLATPLAAQDMPDRGRDRGDRARGGEARADMQGADRGGYQARQPEAGRDGQQGGDRGDRPDARPDRRPDSGMPNAGGRDQRGQDQRYGAGPGDPRFSPNQGGRPIAVGEPDPRGGYRGGRPDDARRGDPRDGDLRGGPRGGDRGGYDDRGYDRGGPDRGGPGQPGYGGRWAGNDGRAWNDGRGRQDGGWDRGWRGDRRFDWQDRRAADRDRFRAPRYYPPRGFGSGYRRWSVGTRLSPLLFARGYWLNDTDYYGLPPAYGPYRWVRYYGDVLLVDVRTGYVADMVPGFFL